MFKCVAMIGKLEDSQLAIKVGAFLKKAFSLGMLCPMYCIVYSVVLHTCWSGQS